MGRWYRSFHLLILDPSEDCSSSSHFLHPGAGKALRPSQWSWGLTVLSCSEATCPGFQSLLSQAQAGLGPPCLTLQVTKQAQHLLQAPVKSAWASPCLESARDLIFLALEFQAFLITASLIPPLGAAGSVVHMLTRLQEVVTVWINMHDGYSERISLILGLFCCKMSEVSSLT